MHVDQKELQRRIGQHLRERREQQSMTRDQLEETSGVGAHFIGNIERGENIPSMKALLMLANALRVDPAYFLQAPQVSLPKGSTKRDRQLQRLHRWSLSADDRSLELLIQIAETIKKP